MVLDILLASAGIGFGFLVIYIAIENKEADKEFMIAGLIGAALVIAGGWYILSTISLWLLLKKLGGFIIAAIGFFLMFGFQDTDDYQPRAFSMTALIIGVILLVFGLYLLFF